MKDIQRTKLRFYFEKPSCVGKESKGGFGHFPPILLHIFLFSKDFPNFGINFLISLRKMRLPCVSIKKNKKYLRKGVWIPLGARFYILTIILPLF
jgi:hypothetical protein